MTTLINNQICIRLQSYGYAPAKKAGELKVGDKIIYNFGVIYDVKEVSKKTDKTIFYKVVSPAGVEYPAQSRIDRYVGVTNNSL